MLNDCRQPGTEAVGFPIRKRIHTIEYHIFLPFYPTIVITNSGCRTVDFFITINRKRADGKCLFAIPLVNRLFVMMHVWSLI